jgi:uncharacterized membrane protein YqjE
MNRMRSLIATLVPALLRHLEAYADLAGEDVRDAATLLSRKLAAVLAAVAAGFIALLMLCFWLVALAWDGPWRNWVAGGLALGFALAAAALALPVLRPRDGPPAFFSRTRTELGRDRELLQRAFAERRKRDHRDDHEQSAG